MNCFYLSQKFYLWRYKAMKKRIIEIVAIIATVSLMVGCAATTSNEKVEDKRPIENAIITEDEVVNPEDNWVDNGNSNAILEEKDDCFVYSIADASTCSKVGEVIKDLDNSLGEDEVKLTKSVNFYLSDGSLMGYTKPNITTQIIARGSKWSSIQINGINKMYWVLNEDLDDARDKNATNNSNNFDITPKSGIMYAKSSVNVRSGPDTSYDKLGGLTTNQKVTITGQADNGWYEIDYNGEKGYVSNSYLSDTKVETNSGNNNSNTNNNSNAGNNDSNSGNNGGGNSNNGGNDTQPQTPVATISAAEAQADIEAACRAHGLVSYPEYVNQLIAAGEYDESERAELMSWVHEASWFQTKIRIDGIGNGDYYPSAFDGSPAFTIEYVREDSGYYIFTCYAY